MFTLYHHEGNKYQMNVFFNNFFDMFHYHRCSARKLKATNDVKQDRISNFYSVVR